MELSDRGKEEEEDTPMELEQPAIDWTTVALPDLSQFSIKKPNKMQLHSAAEAICASLSKSSDMYETYKGMITRTRDHEKFITSYEDAVTTLWNLWLQYGSIETVKISDVDIQIMDKETKADLWNTKMEQPRFFPNRANWVALCREFKANFYFFEMLPQHVLENIFDKLEFGNHDVASMIDVSDFLSGAYMFKESSKIVFISLFKNIVEILSSNINLTICYKDVKILNIADDIKTMPHVALRINRQTVNSFHPNINPSTGPIFKFLKTLHRKIEDMDPDKDLKDFKFTGYDNKEILIHHIIMSIIAAGMHNDPDFCILLKYCKPVKKVRDPIEKGRTVYLKDFKEMFTIGNTTLDPELFHICLTQDYNTDMDYGCYIRFKELWAFMLAHYKVWENPKERIEPDEWDWFGALSEDTMEKQKAIGAKLVETRRLGALTIRPAFMGLQMTDDTFKAQNETLWTEESDLLLFLSDPAEYLEQMNRK
jgi:hypothetical protein